MFGWGWFHHLDHGAAVVNANMTYADDAQQANQQVYQQGGGYDNPEPDNKGKFSHELIAGGAAFEGFKLFENQQRKEGGYSSIIPLSASFGHAFLTDRRTAGKTVDHAFAKELLAGIVGGEVDKLAETHGMNEYDKYEARKHATEGASNMYDQHYVQNQGARDYNPNEYGAPEQINNYDDRYQRQNNY